MFDLASAWSNVDQNAQYANCIPPAIIRRGFCTLELSFEEASTFLWGAKSVLSDFEVLSLDPYEVNRLGGEMAFGAEVAASFACDSVSSSIFIFRTFFNCYL